MVWSGCCGSCASREEGLAVARDKSDLLCGDPVVVVLHSAERILIIFSVVMIHYALYIQLSWQLHPQAFQHAAAKRSGNETMKSVANEIERTNL